VISISNLYSKFSKLPTIEKALAVTDPRYGAGHILLATGIDPMKSPSTINISAGFLIWWKQKQRMIWRVTADAASYLQTVNLAFIPEAPPESWRGESVVIESDRFDQPFPHNIFSLACYRTKDGKEEICTVIQENFTAISGEQTVTPIYMIPRKKWSQTEICFQEAS
jgi:hypothetical protein